MEQLLSESQNSGLCLYWFCLGAMSTRFLESNWFVWVTQMNHIPMHIDYDRNVDWVSTQVRDSHLEDLGATNKKGGWAQTQGRGWAVVTTDAPKPCLVSLKLLSCHHVEKGVTRDRPALPGEGWAGLSIWYPEPCSPDLLLQLQATCNVHKSAFNDWFSGHLNFQIEHQ